jgi:hypothetical protein
MQTLVVLVFAFVLQSVMAQNTNIQTSVNTTGSKEQSLSTVQARQARLESPKAPSQDRSQILRLDGMSSQAWTTIATRKTYSTVFHDAREHESSFGLCLVGRKQ